MWKSILALEGKHRDAGPIVGAITTAVGWAHPDPVRDMVGPVGAGLFLEGESTDAMPEGYPAPPHVWPR